MNKILPIAALFIFGACSDSRHNYEFRANQGIVTLMFVNQSEMPTVEQVSSMSEVAGRTRWNFCARPNSSAEHDCVHGNAFHSVSFPDSASCLSALHSINAALKRETTADQVKVCTYPAPH